jgi:general secretion pathway protein G
MKHDFEILPNSLGRWQREALTEGLVSPTLTPPDRSRGRPPHQDGEDCEGGFSLVELMVVLVIIGLLTALVAFNVLPQQDKALVGKAKADIANIDSALDMYKLNNLTYPAPGEGLQALVAQKVIKKLPNDPWGRPYRYDNPGRRGDVDVYSLGADGVEGGEEDNADIGNWQ